MKKLFLLLVALVMLQQLANSQCYMDRHSTNYFDGWISCEAALNPNPARPVSHFIMYDFGKTYKLGQMEIWNSNDPAHLDWGMRDVAIDYSVDGENWSNAGTYTFAQASGLSTYEGSQGPDLAGVEGRYLLITAINNYGGECFGLSEFRVNGEEVIISDVNDPEQLACVNITIYPNPFAEKMNLVLAPGCNGVLEYALYDALGHLLKADKATLISGQEKAIEIARDLPSGAYMLNIEFGGKSMQKRIVKMNRT